MEPASREGPFDARQTSLTLAAVLTNNKLNKLNIMKSNQNKLRLAQAVLLARLLWAETMPAQETFTKPAWMTDLSLGFKGSYDNNIYGVSGNGLQPEGSWVNTTSPKVGFNFAPLLGGQPGLQALSLSYAPDLVQYLNAPAEDYEAHKMGAGIKGSFGDFSFSLDNAFLYNEGNKMGIDYALNQLSGKKANQDDKYRNTFAQAMVRERRDQIQDRAAAVLQYDVGKVFVRPTSSFLDYNLDTAFENTKKAPYLGYQNWVDRSDVNGGLDLGYKLTASLAATLGYRYGSQFQQQFAKDITTDLHYASSTYQRWLMGLEGKPCSWLEVKMSAGPDFRNFNPDAPVTDYHPVEFYGDAAVTATITTHQNVTLNYKQWQWVSSTGFVPDYESSYGINYHWSATKKWGFDLGGKIQEQNYLGNDYAGSEPSRRADRMYSVMAGVSYAFDTHFSAGLNYSIDVADSVLASLPAALEPAYRNFTHEVISLGVSCKF